MNNGRRNCKRCTRWKLAVEFKWRWRVPEYTQKPTIDTVCRSCRRAEERERYANMLPEDKAAKIAKANKRTRERYQAVKQARLIARSDPKFKPGERVDFVPFRMWLLYQFSHNGGLSVKEYATKAGISPDSIRRWLDGFEWRDRSCEPVPIQTIRLRTVEDVTTKLGHPEAVRAIYPFQYD